MVQVRVNEPPEPEYVCAFDYTYVRVNTGQWRSSTDEQDAIESAKNDAMSSKPYSVHERRGVLYSSRIVLDYLNCDDPGHAPNGCRHIRVRFYKEN